ncbi:MAG: DUF2207 domain-containing protein, partial [Candidatus Methanoplasma sp.]|nr:DUF2207 domain-containing protein [Candidatus Methanoplasma sp.]
MRIAEKVVPAVFLAVFFSIFIFFFFVYDDNDGGDGFDHYKTSIGITIREDGSAVISETYDVRWHDISTGEVYRWLPDDMVSKVDMSSVICMIDGRPAERVSYQAGSQATYTGPDGMALYAYGWNPLSDNWEMNAFFKRAASGEHTIVFQYDLGNAVVRYADCVDFYYKVFTSFPDDLNDLTVTVTMPSGSQQSSTYIFGHGGPDDHCRFIEGTADSVFKSPKLDAYSMFEIRVVSQQTYLYSIVPISTEKTLGSILDEEKGFRDRTNMAVMLGYVMIAMCIAMVSFAVLFALFRSRIIKRNKPTFGHPYMRELPAVKPNIAATFGDYYKLRKGNFGNKITATILNLALQKIIAIEKGTGKEIVFVSLNGNASMTMFERNVYNMIFRSGNGSRVTLGQVKDSLSGYSADNSQLFGSDRTEFDRGGYIDPELEKRNRKWKHMPFVPFVLLFLIFIISAATDATYYLPFGFISAAVSLLLLAYCTSTIDKSLTVAGEDERAKANALKRFYTDMTLIKERRAMELPIWEQHLVYATALGVADKVIKELDMRLAEIGVLGPGNNLTYM